MIAQDLFSSYPIFVLSDIVFNRPDWWPIVVASFALLTLIVIYNYASHNRLKHPVSWLLIGLKVAAFVLFAVCLLEPMNSFEWPRPQEKCRWYLGGLQQVLKVGIDESSLANLRQNTLESESEWQRRVAQDLQFVAIHSESKRMRRMKLLR